MKLTLDNASGLVPEARQVSSPNCDHRPPRCEPELIVVHAIALPPGEFGGPWVDQLFCNCLDPEEHEYFAEIHKLKVSAHFLIDRSGQLTQYVPVNQRAWHAGASAYQGREACNDFSVGIELEGDEVTPYTDAQYQRLAQLIQTLRGTVKSLENAPIVGHSDIAPGRKSDPGEVFDWRRLHHLLEA
jgi:AmpD protein